MKGIQKAEGMTFFEGEATPIYSISCPVCQSDRLESLPFGYVCLVCGTQFDTKEDEDD